jgi:hypothetical protein
MNDLFGYEIGERMASLAADNAGEEWKTLAYNALVSYAKTHDIFTIEDVRRASHDVPLAPTERAWGHIAISAKKDNVISRHGTANVQNGRMIAVLWKSNIKAKNE